jgi:hypothetical protein
VGLVLLTFHLTLYLNRTDTRRGRHRIYDKNDFPEGDVARLGFKPKTLKVDFTSLFGSYRSIPEKK